MYASFYNDNAYLERLRRGVNENDVGMALLVHHSTPDTIEMANGVAKVSIFETNRHVSVSLVTQKGAVPVANPDNTALPEIISGSRLMQSSSLVPMRAYVMDWPADYNELRNLLASVGGAYAQLMAKQGSFLLDFEYKKVEPGWLEVKQVRELPSPRTNSVAARYLLNDPVVLIPHQGVETDLFATHRLKSRWTIHTRNARLDAATLALTLVTSVTIEHLNSNRIETISMPLTNLTGLAYSVRLSDGVWRATHSWRMPTLVGLADVQIVISFWAGSPSSQIDSPITAVRSFWLHAAYPQPVPSTRYWQWSSQTNESIYVGPTIDVRSVPTARRIEHTSTFLLDQKTITISTVGDHGIEGGDNPWLVGTLRTRVEGLTTEPIVLTNFFSQTTANFHVSSVHDYLFEPRLEPGIPQSTLSELDALDVQLLYFSSGGPGQRAPVLKVMSRDGTFRDVPPAEQGMFTITVTSSDGFGLPPGSVYTIKLQGGGIYVYDDGTSTFSGSYSFQRSGSTATLITDNIFSVLTFETLNTGSIHREFDGLPAATEDGTFVFE